MYIEVHTQIIRGSHKIISKHRVLLESCVLLSIQDKKEMEHLSKAAKIWNLIKE